MKQTKRMKILIACEYSGTVRDEFIKRGHDAISCDILPTESEGPHFMGDVSLMLYQNWDMIIAHPPCTYLANSGVQHLHKDQNRWSLLDQGAAFFNLFLSHPCEKICIENPIPHKYAIQRFYKNKKYDQIVQPYQFGHPESKKTCLWLKGLPTLKDTKNVKEYYNTLSKKEQQKIFYISPGPERSKLRSKTFKGIAEAMANQWG